MLTLVFAVVVAQPVDALPAVSLITGTRDEQVILDVTPDGAVARTVKTDHLVAPLRGTLTEVERLKLATIVELMANAKPPKPPPPGEGFRVTLVIGKKTFTAPSKEALGPQLGAMVQVLDDLSKRLMRPSRKR
ncbi:MAG: hypothetical protein IAE78_24375 [Myxococcus sp.]|nr:hypothetical protein [Myxococcus sp.]